MDHHHCHKAADCLDEDIVVGQAGGCVVVRVTTMAKLGIMVTGVDPQQCGETTGQICLD